jgi:hypothetical protein
VSWTKRQYVTAALEEAGLASYVFDLQPDQIESAVRRLDSMMAEWNARGIRLGYPLPADPDSTDIDADAGTPDSAHEAVVTNLAIRLAPSYGKTVAAETKATARHALNTLMARAAMPSEMQLPSSLPSGAGNRGQTYMPEPDEPITGGPDGTLPFEEV